MKPNIFYVDGKFILANNCTLETVDTDTGEQSLLSPITSSETLLIRSTYYRSCAMLINLYNMAKSASIPWENLKTIEDYYIDPVEKISHPDQYNFIKENMTLEGERKQHPFSRYSDRATIHMSEGIQG